MRSSPRMRMMRWMSIYMNKSGYTKSTAEDLFGGTFKFENTGVLSLFLEDSYCFIKFCFDFFSNPSILRQLTYNNGCKC